MNKSISGFTAGCIAGILLGMADLSSPAVLAADADDRCIAVHAAYDVGSSTTKVKVARVDGCSREIIEVLLDRTEPVAYQEDLARSDGDVLSEGIRERGANVLRELQEAAAEHEPDRELGVATAALREATGGEAFIRSLADETGIDLRVISDEEEATMGFRAAVAAAGVDAEQAIVWDIGGGSMQVVAGQVAEGDDGDDNGAGGGGAAPIYYEGNTSSVRFRNRIIELKGHDVEATSTPNPISDEVADEALAMARELASDIPETLAQRMRDPGAKMIGIGGVHYFSIRGQLETDDGPYTRHEVAAKLETRIGQTDEQIGGSFADTEVSNLILVLGYMQAWDIEKIQPVHATMSDGLLLGQAFECRAE